VFVTSILSSGVTCGSCNDEFNKRRSVCHKNFCDDSWLTGIGSTLPLLYQIHTYTATHQFFSPSGSHIILVFPRQTVWQYFDGDPITGASNAVMRCLPVCLSVCVTVTFVDHVKTNKDMFEIFSPPGSHTILVFPRQTA